MLINTRLARLPLSLGRFARLHKARACRVTALHGSAWITIDNDPRDIVLSPGETFVVDTDACLLVSPLRREHPLELCVEAPLARTAPRRGAEGLWSRLRHALLPVPAASRAVA